MRLVLLILALVLAPVSPAFATFSIVGFDPATGDLGIAVASRYFAVGAVVPWADAGVGAVATQAGVNVGYGPRALELLRSGLTAQQVMDRLFAEDTFPRKEGRQVAIIDAKGNIAVITGDAANAWRGHVTGKTWSAQGNILVGPHVVEAMGRAFDATNDELAEKLYAALKAGDDPGGDSRGRQSASILVVRKGGGRNTNNDRYVFINVDDHPDPMHELRRLLNLQMFINYGAPLAQALNEGRYPDALKAAEKLAHYQPLDAAQHMRLGLVAYTAGNRERAMTAFARARELTLPAQFKTIWDDQLTRTAAFKKAAGDAALVAALSSREAVSTARMRKLILRNFQSPGDILMLTAAVRDLHRAHPGEFLTDVRTPFPDLWAFNPHLTPLSDDDPDAVVFDCHYPLIHQSNTTPVHFLHAFHADLNERLGLRIRVTDFKGDIHLGKPEREWFAHMAPLDPHTLPYWLIVSGGKRDYTIKWWDPARHQRVVDHFRDRIQFVQVGDPSHHHPALEGVVDLRGQTTIRQLVRLMYFAEGVVSPVSLLMHLAAAVETPPGRPRSRPCVVVAGGREPPHFTAYPHHQFIHTVGMLRCCDQGGCWRSRTVPLGDGDLKDRPDQLCVDVVGALPRCMHLITAEDVIRRIDLYFEGGSQAHRDEQPA